MSNDPTPKSDTGCVRYQDPCQMKWVFYAYVFRFNRLVGNFEHSATYFTSTRLSEYSILLHFLPIRLILINYVQNTHRMFQFNDRLSTTASQTNEKPPFKPPFLYITRTYAWFWLLCDAVNQTLCKDFQVFCQRQLEVSSFRLPFLGRLLFLDIPGYDWFVQLGTELVLDKLLDFHR